ncbi:hypothetical protein [Paraburkholderia sp. UCT31]|uniref:hypothetical protein n=1 Tax=Paraburkholderia sp. UCT31 TaxID=2615209 RepID=UPI001655D37D|nr:hypothetical protein [Paraburkholderia sp. UCT31]
MDKFIKFSRYLDFLGSLAVLGWGLYTRSPWWLVSGCVGVAVAWYAPASRINARLKKKFLGGSPVFAAAGTSAAAPRDSGSSASAGSAVGSGRPDYSPRWDAFMGRKAAQ